MARRNSAERSTKRAAVAVAPSATGIGALWLALIPTSILACFGVIDRVYSTPRLLAGFAGAVAVLVVFFVFLYRQVESSGRKITYEFAPRPVHYVQFAMQAALYAYWGWYWRQVYQDLFLIGAQIVFAYALDMLICWSRRDKYVLGFGPVPIVVSANLFLWFKDDWFFLQFLLIAVALLGKEFIKWTRDGHRTHIFNPSAFALFLFSVVLLATRSTDLTWGVQIATTFHRPPHIYLEIFFLGLVVQALFRVTLVTLSSAAALYALNLWYTSTTGDYQFIDSNIPVAVFLGLHLLTTDPATSPRRDLGKIIFGALYGAGAFYAYTLLKMIDGPEFYDKLLIVPFLNLGVKGLDHLSDAVADRFKSLTAALRARPRALNFAWMGVWAGLFVTMTASGFLVKGTEHPGSKPELWGHLCEKGRTSACPTWINILRGKCQEDSAADCLALGNTLEAGKYVKKDTVEAGVTLGRSCDSGLKDACISLLEYMRKEGTDPLASACDRGDGAGCFVLGSLFSAGAGVPKNPDMAFELFRKSCDVGWPRGCGRLGLSYLLGQGVRPNPGLAIANFEKGCQGKNAASCLEAAQFYQAEKSRPIAKALARDRLQQACDLGLQAACQAGVKSASTETTSR